MRHYPELSEDQSDRCRDQVLGTHYSWSRKKMPYTAVNTARVNGRVYGCSEHTTCVHGPWTSPVFPGGQKMPSTTVRPCSRVSLHTIRYHGPCTQPVFTGRTHGPWSRVVSVLRA